MTKTTCDVQGCESPRERLFVHRERGNGIREIAVCQFHSTALEADEKYEITDDNVIILNPKDVFDIVDADWEITDSGTTITLKLGHDGIESHRVKFRFSEAMLTRLNESIHF